MNVLITVTGVVQGVGFRPFVAKLARELSISGTVMNSDGIVIINAECNDKKTLDEFVYKIKKEQPLGADVRDIIIKNVESTNRYIDFTIITSKKTGCSNELPLIPTDLPVCDECRKELIDTQNRRFLYPFISCVSCGPRYSIIKDLPYDRERTTMDIFPMCSECKKEYSDENNRRCHAQTVSCHDCGPQLVLQYRDRQKEKKFVIDRNDALEKSIELINNGDILAIKGIGGYQLACLPSNDKTVGRLRLLKHRDNKPFAIMFPSIESIREYCKVGIEEEKLLLSNAMPVLLLRKHSDLSDNSVRFGDNVCGESLFIGAFLPYTPLHVLLTEACGPLVMTSGNLTNEPIIIDDKEILDVLDSNSDNLAGVLYSKREILTPLDDSVTRMVLGRSQIIRRSRGYVPEPIFLEQKTDRTILATGGDLKSSFCLYKGGRAYLSQYFGDLDNFKVSKVYLENIEKMQKLFTINPDLVVCDMHPGYISSNMAKSFGKEHDLPVMTVQHHHAHAASVMAENDIESCIAVVFDGTGYGTDGAIWGGEFLLCNGADFERKGHLNYVTLCGGDSVSVNASQSLKCYLYAAGIDSLVNGLEDGESKLIESALTHKIQTYESSSTGRLFDAISALLDVKYENTFEGECAIALEKEAVLFNEKYPEYVNELFFDIEFDKNDTIINQTGFIKNLFLSRNGLFNKKSVENNSFPSCIETQDDNLQNSSKTSKTTDCRAYTGHEEKKQIFIDPVDYTGSLAYAFHNALTDMMHRTCIFIRQNSDENKVVLSGGVFANVLLLESCVKILEESGFEVFINRKVPTNDGGLSLGQAWIAARQNMMKE